MTEAERRLPGWLLPAGLGVLVVALVAIALVRDPMQLDPDSPEGTVQAYLTAIKEERWDDAAGFLHEDWRGSCTGVHVQSAVYSDFSAQLGWDNGRAGGSTGYEHVVLIGPDGEPVDPPPVPHEPARVEVTIRYGRESIFFFDRWDDHVEFELVDDDGSWWLIGAPWPYFSWDCAGH